MKSILDIRIKEGAPYFKNGSIIKILDRLKIKKESLKEFKLLDKRIVRVSIPPNYDKNAYYYNVSKTMEKYKWNSVSIRGNRVYDMDYLDDFQKSMISFGIVKSISIILINNKKSIKNSFIAIEDGGNTKNLPIIEECAKHTKRMLLIAKDFKKASNIRNYIIANYGVSPEITVNFNSIKGVDFIITEKNREYNAERIWYLDSFYRPYSNKGLFVNDISFSIDNYKEKFSPELLGALLKPDKKVNKYIEDYIISNKVRIEDISFGDKEIEMNFY